MLGYMVEITYLCSIRVGNSPTPLNKQQNDKQNDKEGVPKTYR